MKAITYLDLLKEKLNLRSDYALEKHLGASKGTVTSYRSGRRMMDDIVATKVAGELGVPAIEVIAAANEEREQDAERKAYWSNYRKKLAATAGGIIGTVLVAATMTAAPNDAQAAFNTSKIIDSGKYTLSKILAWIKALFRTPTPGLFQPA